VSGWPEPVLFGAPQVVGDSLVGRRIAMPGTARGPRVAAPLASVLRVEEYRTDVRGTTTLVVAGLLGLAALFYAFLTYGLS
jgi:hypothetical protein